MIVGEFIAIVGTALSTRLTPALSDLAWAASLVVTGYRDGYSMQLPYTAVQLAL